jgi:hypothetical protein
VVGSLQPALISVTVGAFYSEVSSVRSVSSPVLGTLVPRRASTDQISTQAAWLTGATSGFVAIQAPPAPTSYTLDARSSSGLGPSSIRFPFAMLFARGMGRRFVQ